MEAGIWAVGTATGLAAITVTSRFTVRGLTATDGSSSAMRATTMDVLALAADAVGLAPRMGMRVSLLRLFLKHDTA